MNKAFFSKLLKDCDYLVDAYDGKYRWYSSEKPTDEDLLAIEALPASDEWLKVDLSTLGCSMGLKMKLQGLQVERIRIKRVEAYALQGITPEQWMNAQIDGSPSPDELKAKRDAVKADWPWPSYR